MSNLKKYCIYTAIYSVGFMFCSGAIIQTFLLQIGLSEQQVYVFNSLTQIAQVVMMLVMTFLSAKIKSVKLISGLSYLSLSILTVVFMLGALNPSIFGNIYIIILFITVAISYLGVGLYSILSYILPYYVIDMKEYGKMSGISVLASGGVSFAFSFVHAFIVSKFNYMQVMTWFFILALICFILTAIFCLSMKELARQDEEVKTTKEDIVAVFKNRYTYVLLLPNFARGLAAGIMSVITVVAISVNILNEQTASYVNIVMQIAIFAGNALYVATYKKLTSNLLLLISTIGLCIFFPISIVGGLVCFLVLFFVAYFFRMIIDTAIPVIITEIIPQNQIGAYTSIRMLVFIGAQAVATLIITPLVGVIGYVGLLICASIMQLICGVVYYIVAKKNKVIS